MKWITRERAKVDRIAYPWLISRFIDPTPKFIYVPAEQVLAEAEQRGAIPYDVEGAQVGHQGPFCNVQALTRKGRTHTCSALLLAVLLILVFLAQVGDAGASDAITLDFEATVVGELPTGFSTAVTGAGGPPSWVVVEDPTAPSGGKVLAQRSTDKTSAHFPLCIYDHMTAEDVEVSVRFKPISGTVDQAAGLVARFKDQDNYYIVRANALEDNVRLYKVKRGKRTQFAGANVKVLPHQWQSLTLAVKGTHFRVFLNDTLLFEADDPTFKDAGKVGLWTKADSVTYFDALSVKTAAAR